MIDTNKKYTTRSGLPVRVVCTNMKCSHGKSVLALVTHPDGSEYSYSYFENGRFVNPYENHVNSEYDLVEVSPYAHLKTDDKVYVWDYDIKKALKRHFSHVSKFGNPCVFNDGVTSWSTNGTTTKWDNCLSEADYLKMIKENK